MEKEENEEAQEEEEEDEVQVQVDLRLEIPPSSIPDSSSAPCHVTHGLIVINIIICNTFSPIISSPGCADVCNLFAEFRQGRHNGSGGTSESISFDKGKQTCP